MKYRYKIEYTAFVLLLCAGFGWILNEEFDMAAYESAGDAKVAQTTTRKIIRLIAPAQVEVTKKPILPTQVTVVATSTNEEASSTTTVESTSSSTTTSSSTPQGNGKQKGRRGSALNDINL